MRDGGGSGRGRWRDDRQSAIRARPGGATRPWGFAGGLVLLLLAVALSSCGGSVGGTPDVGGTYWSGTDSQGHLYVYRFLPDGHLGYTSPGGTYGDADDTWTQNGASIRMSMNAGYAIREGTIAGDQMSGSAHNVEGSTWTWSATRQGTL